MDISLVASVGVVDEAEAVSAVAFVVAVVMAVMSTARSCPIGRVVGVGVGPGAASTALCSVGKILPNVSFAHWRACTSAVRDNALSVTYVFFCPLNSVWRDKRARNIAGAHHNPTKQIRLRQLFPVDTQHQFCCQNRRTRGILGAELVA